MKKTMTYVFLLIALVGCAQMMNIGQLSERYSKFDNSRNVYMSPAFVWRGEEAFAGALSVHIGAQWSSTTPDIIQLTANHTGSLGGGAGRFSGASTGGIGAAYLSIDSMAFNADGKIIAGRKVLPLTKFDAEQIGVGVPLTTMSQQNFAFTRREIEELVSAKRAIIQIQTSAGILEGLFHSTVNEEHTAKFGLKQLLTKI